jgi:predicted ferric reductase
VARARRLSQDQREVVTFAALLGGAVAVIALWWLDNPSGLSSVADRVTGAGRLTGLVGTYLVLVQVVLMARLPQLDRWLGTDRLAAWHRSGGQYTIILLSAHAVLVTWGYALSDHVSLTRETTSVLRHYPDVLAATVGLAALAMVGVVSARAVRRHVRYETWYFVHLYAYIAIALSFSHQFATGDDFVNHPLNRWLWGALFVATFGALVVCRVCIPIQDALAYRLRVAEVRPEAGGAVSVFFTGRNLDRLRAEAGQFFRWRFLDRTGWWEAHPFSLSAPVNGRFLRVTVKGLGDHSQALRHLKPGTRVMAEGPYGNLTAQRRRKARVALIAGGVGITPLRTLLETIEAPAGGLTLLYRASTERDVLFRRELDRLGERRGADIHYLVGDRYQDHLSSRSIETLVPDVVRRDVYVCGPPGMMERTLRSLRKLGVPKAQIHRERFEL